MDFMTPVRWNYPGPLLTRGESFFLLGSCFSGEFARLLESFGEEHCLNPFGTLYDPTSMVRALEILEKDDWKAEEELFFHKGLWRHPDFNTDAAHPDRDRAVEKLYQARDRGRQAWGRSTVAVFTYGTAFSYRHRDTARIWANCHTLPGFQFQRRPGDPHTLAQEWEPVLTLLKARGTKVFLTLSPVRHLRNDAGENSLSKALLRVFLHLLEQKGLGTYFPASEILLDELRDYRWYAEDMVHPSPQAAGYITGRFWDGIAGQELKERAEAYGALVKEFRHRPRHPGSGEDQKRQDLWLEKKAHLLKNYPGWNPPDFLPGPEDLGENGT